MQTDISLPMVLVSSNKNSQLKKNKWDY